MSSGENPHADESAATRLHLNQLAVGDLQPTVRGAIIDRGPGLSASRAGLLSLQRTIGNRALGRLGGAVSGRATGSGPPASTPVRPGPDPAVSAEAPTEHQPSLRQSPPGLAAFHAVVLASAVGNRAMTRLISRTEISERPAVRHPERARPGIASAPVRSGRGMSLPVAPGRLLQRDIVVSGGVTYYEFRLGVELSVGLAQAASIRTRSGALSRASLPALIAIAEHETWVADDPARLFLAGLLEPTNAALLRSAASATSVRFPVSAITAANRAAVDDAGRPPLLEASATVGPATPSQLRADEAAVRALRRAVGPLRAQGEALRAFAHDHGVPARQVLAAMQASAAGPDADDRLIAGCAYAIARAAGAPIASSLLSGDLHVDAVAPSTAARGRVVMAGAVAQYVRRPMPPVAPTPARPGGPGMALRGDTLYVPRDFRIDNAMHRSILLHELGHARQDLTGIQSAHPAQTSAVYLPTFARDEYEAYRDGAIYLLEEVATMSATARARAQYDIVSFLHVHRNPAYLRALLLVAGANRARDEPFVTGVLTNPDIPIEDRMTAAGVAAALGQTESGREHDLEMAVSRVLAALGPATLGGAMIHDALGRPSIADYGWVRPSRPPTLTLP
jgi:hypothetical protein